MLTDTEKALEQRARRAAAAAGLRAKKSRRFSADRGGFMLVDPQVNYVIAGSDFDLTAEDVLASSRFAFSARIQHRRAQADVRQRSLPDVERSRPP
jgi:hypothetical protein